MSYVSKLSVVVVLVSVLLPASVVIAQVNWLGDAQLVDGDEPQNGVTFAGPVTAASTSNGLAVTGDVVITADDSLPRQYFMSARRLFQVGPLPVLASISYPREFKLAVGGGPSEPGQSPMATLENYSYLLDSTASVMVDPLSIETQYYYQEANGYTVFSETFITNSYVLSPGVVYSLELADIMTCHYQSQGLPTMTATWEFGAISSFDGLSATLTWQTVPEPGTLALLALGALAITRFRNHGRLFV